MNRKLSLSVSIFVLVLVTALTLTGFKKKPKPQSFSFVFFTDVHLQPENNAVSGFLKAIDLINKLNPDFVIAGGDQIMDALAQRHSRADSLYTLYQETAGEFRMPLYNTLGNHEIYGIYVRSGADKNHPDYGEKMFENRFGKSYYSVDHKGWKFMILNSVEDTGEDRYIGLIDQKQIEWIKEELQRTDPATPLVISTHIPFLTVFTQKYEGTTVANRPGLVVTNGKEVIDLFNGYNLKLVLQGHLHTVEEISIDGIRFITGGAVSGGWWKGPNRGFEEGFVLVKVKGDDFDWEYVDYGWVVN